MEEIENIIIKYLKENKGFGITITDSDVYDYIALDGTEFEREPKCIKITGFDEFVEKDEHKFRKRIQYILEINDIKELYLDSCSLTIYYKNGQEIELTNWD